MKELRKKIGLILEDFDSNKTTDMKIYIDNLINAMELYISKNLEKEIRNGIVEDLVIEIRKLK